MYDEYEIYENASMCDSSVDNTTISSKSTDRGMKRAKNLLNMVDNGKYKMTLQHNREKVKIACFSTDSTNHAYIRNAVSGIIQPHRACSGQQDLYYKVIDVSGLGTSTKIPKHLYYDSPEEYERHQNREVSISTKKRWYEKYLKAKLKYN